MDRLSFECPIGGQKIDVGIESELGTLLRIREKTVRAYCDACETFHEWPVGDAHLTTAA